MLHQNFVDHTVILRVTDNFSDQFDRGIVVVIAEIIDIYSLDSSRSLEDHLFEKTNKLNILDTTIREDKREDIKNKLKDFAFFLP
jgi:hypothetical protein